MIRTTPTLVTPPAAEPVTLDEAKTWLRVSHSDEDTAISSLISAARDVAEKYMRRALVTQTWKISADLPSNKYGSSLPDGTYNLPISVLNGDLPTEVDLPYKPIQSITSVQTYDTANTASTYSSSNYFLDTASGRMVLNNTAVWPSNLRDKAALVVTYVAGYDKISNIPPSIKNAIKMHVHAMYDARTECEIPMDAMRIYDQYKIYG